MAGGRSVRMRRWARRRRVRAAVFGLLFLAVAVVGGALAVTVFFKISSIKITGKTRYSEQQIEQALGVHQGDNLFLWGQALGVRRLQQTYPYISTVAVHRKLPDHLVLEITDAVPVGAIHDDRYYWLIDAQGKLLERVSQAGKYPKIEGIDTEGFAAGQTLNPQEGNGSALVLLQILSALQQSGDMKHVNFLNLNRLYDIHMGYDGRFDVWLGTASAMEHKLQFLNAIISEKLSPSDMGVIDLSGDNAARFQPETAAQVAAAAVNTVASSEAQAATEDVTGTDSVSSDTDGTENGGTSE